MNLGSDIHRRFFAAVLATLLLMLSVSQPVLEQADVGTKPIVEAEHAPGDCPQGHHHLICTQVSANHAAPGTAALQRPNHHLAAAAAPAAFLGVALSAAAEGHPTRAPPRV